MLLLSIFLSGLEKDVIKAFLHITCSTSLQILDGGPWRRSQNNHAGKFFSGVLFLLLIPISRRVLQIEYVINVQLRAVIVFEAELVVPRTLEHHIPNFTHGEVSILLVDRMPAHFYQILLQLLGHFLDLGLFSY